MNIQVLEKTTHVTIYVLIVEDDRDKAFSLKKIIEEYNSIFNDAFDFNGNKLDIKYTCIINGTLNLIYEKFNGDFSFQKSKEFIQCSAKEVDIIFCDYDLGNSMGNGDRFLQLVKEEEARSEKRIYKILHSVKSQFQKFQGEPYINAIYDAKDEDTIREISIPAFEIRILKVLLYGNPSCYDELFKTDETKRLIPNILYSEPLYKQIPLRNILYVYSSGYGKENYYFVYLDEEYNLAEDNHFDSISVFDTNIFLKMGRSLYISKVWHSDSDAVNNQVKFISFKYELSVLDITKALKRLKQKTLLYEVFSKLQTLSLKNKLPASIHEPFFRFQDGK